MKITVIGPTHPYKGGISHFTTILVRELRKKHQVDFISWKRQYPAFLYPVELKDTKSKFQIKEEAKYILDFINPISWVKGFLEIKKNKSELLIFTWIVPIQAPIYFVINFLVKIFTKGKILFICHNVLPHEEKFYDKSLAKLAFSQVDKFIVHSKEDKKILDKLVKNKKVTVGFLPIFNMFPNNQKYNIPKIKKELNLNKKVLLFFGYIRPYKGLKYLIEAMSDILKTFPDLSLLVVGEFWSKDKQSYFDIVNKLGVKNNIVFISNYVPNEEVGKYFAVSDVVVLPYISATQSASIQTAYAFNKPVISTTVGGLDDVIIESQTGYSIKSLDSEDIVNKVKLFYEKKISEEQISRNKSKWSWDKYINLISMN